MKIAFINKYQGIVNRGAETYVAELSKRLSKNHEVYVLNKLNFKNKYDVIIPTNGRWQVFLARILTWIRGSKIIVSGQSGIGIDDRWNLYCFPNYFVALSEYAKEWAMKINPYIKVVKIPNGVDLERFKDVRVKSGAKIKTVLAVGALTANKRHDLTIRALANIPNSRLVLVGGGGELSSQLNELGRRLLGDRRFQIITTTNHKMPEIYNRADVFVFPTVAWESFGIALVEAMASGLPVIASDDPIRREIINRSGFFVDPIDVNKYSQMIEKALEIDWTNEKLLTNLNLVKPRKQAEKFNWDTIAEEYEKLLKEI